MNQPPVVPMCVATLTLRAFGRRLALNLVVAGNVSRHGIHCDSGHACSDYRYAVAKWQPVCYFPVTAEARTA